MEFFLIDNNGVSDTIQKVAKTKYGLIMGQYKNVTIACKKLQISRVTYYKYCDHILYLGKGREEDEGEICKRRSP